jgi:hypothetical protein
LAFFLKMLIGSQGFNLFGDLLDHLDELGGFSRGDPGEVNPVRFDPHVFHQVFKQGEFSTGVVITFQVMAFAGMSPGHPDAVCAFPQRRQKEFGAHPTRAGDPDDPDVGRILHPADAGQVRGAVAAPIAQETDDFRFPFRHVSFLGVIDVRCHPAEPIYSFINSGFKVSSGARYSRLAFCCLQMTPYPLARNLSYSLIHGKICAKI